MKREINFFTDHYFHIGDAHLQSGKPCQDYATSGTSGDAAYAVVSDGCSTGGNTDIGSRFVALSAAVAMKQSGTFAEVKERQFKLLVEAQEKFGLTCPDMYATCLSLYLTKNGGYASVLGDGVIAFVYKDRTAEILQYEWNDNTPYYEAYEEDHNATFLSTHGGDANAICLTEERWASGKDGEWRLIETRGLTLREGMAGIVTEIPEEKLSALAFVAVFSDGVSQIDETEFSSAVREFTSYKNLCGEFAKRRMLKAIKEFQRSGHQMMDDIAVAVISIEEEITT